MGEQVKQRSVVVIGGGYGGIAAAARLAKFGHQVTLCERSGRLGGVLGHVEREGYRWDAGPATMAFPAPLRDLFRKSGRPLERVLDLVPVTSPRRHDLGDGTVLDLPLSGRAPQYQAISTALGRAPAEAWAREVDAQEETWELLRTRALEVPFTGTDDLPRRDRRRLAPRRTLDRDARKLRHPLLRQALDHYAVELGSDPRRTPAFVAVTAYLERTFGRWRVEGGLARLVDALAHRLRERRVDVRLDTEVVGVHSSAGRVTGVELAGGERLGADVVVSDVPPTELYDRLLDDPPPDERDGVRRTRPAAASTLLHLGLRGPLTELPELPHETVLHPVEPGRPTYVVRSPEDATLAPEGHAAWTIVVHHPPPEGDAPAKAPTTGQEEILDGLAARGLDLRERVTVADLRHLAPDGLAWDGAGTAVRRAPNRSQLEGLYSVGAGAHPGAGLPFVALGAATVAEHVGRIARTAHE